MSASSSTTSLPETSQQLSTFRRFLNLPVGLQWRTAALRAQRLVPNSVTYLTAPLGPQPICTELPSRGKHSIPVWIFVPSDKRERKEEKKEEKNLRREEKNIRREEKKQKKGSKKGSDESSQSGDIQDSLSLKSTTSLDSTSSRKSKKSKRPARSLPVHLDFHGGGFTTGSCTEQAPFCAGVARETNRIVITVDYRLGPIDTYPAAVEDAEDVLCAILDSVSDNILSLPKPRRKAAQALIKELAKAKVTIAPNQLSLSGFSSGGNLALGLTVPQSLLTERLPPDQKVPVLLFYPSLDARLLPHERPKPPGMPDRAASSSSVVTLTTTLMSGITESYLPACHRAEIKASPGLADPKTLFPGAQYLLVNAEWDTLALQGRIWVEKMRKEGWGEDRLEMWESVGTKHGWTQFPERWLVEGEVVERDRAFKRALEVLLRGDVRTTEETMNKP